MYEIILSSEAKSQLSKLNSLTKERIGVVLERIKIRPYAFVKRTRDSKYYRARIDNYRIILDIKDTALLIYVLDIDLRGNIYKKGFPF